MARAQIENPPEYVERPENAPSGEIRQEPLSTLRIFSLATALAFVLPAVGMIVGGFIVGRMWIGITGVIIMTCFFVGYYLILWYIMKSRKLEANQSDAQA
jgi:hypothetical protein